MATVFWNTYRQQGYKPIDTNSMKRVAMAEYPHLYVYRCDGGFVVVAGEEVVQPILAYSFDTPFPLTPHPSLRWWLAGYEAQLDALSENEMPATTGSEDGDILPAYGVPHASSRISALLTTMWNQSDPYNVQCPYDSAHQERTVVGCVATAMAQIMKYWKHPLCGTGSHSYRYRSYGTLSADFGNTSYLWEYMPPVLTNASAITSRRTLQTLSYHCGVSVDMMYGPASTGGSGAYSHKVVSALTNYFKYAPGMSLCNRGDFTDSAWAEQILADLYARRPIYYTGHDTSGGHAFVLDGADTSGRYHFNWGWGGFGDGYYALDNLAPGRGGAGSNATNSFNLSQSAIFGIVPVPQQYDTLDYYDTVCNTFQTYQFFDYTLPVTVGHYTLHHLDTVYRLHVAMADRRFLYLDPNGADGLIQQETYCYLTGACLPRCPFVRTNHRFEGWSRTDRAPDTLYQPGDTLHIHNSMVLYAIWSDTTPPPIPDTVDSATDVIFLSPNPTKGQVDVSTGGIPFAQCTLRDAVGRYYGQFIIESGHGTISVADLPRGIYILQISDGEHTFNRRIIKY